MTVTINGTDGVSAVAANAVGAGDIQSAAVSQANLAAGVAGNGPAFSAYANTTQSITGGVTTKVTFNTEYFDTANCFDNSTTYRFTPNVAGYYQLSTGVLFGGTSGVCLTVLYKNGSAYAEFARTYSGGSSGSNGGSVLAYANGTTDYFEVYVYADISQNIGNNNSYQKWFTGALMRAA